MSQQPWTQTYPSPGLDPGFRWDIDGRARFLHKGYTVDVLIRRLGEDAVDYFGDRLGDGHVELTGTITLEGVELVRVESNADITEPHQVREALQYVLDEAARDASLKVARLVRRVDEIEGGEAGR